MVISQLLPMETYTERTLLSERSISQRLVLRNMKLPVLLIGKQQDGILLSRNMAVHSLFFNVPMIGQQVLRRSLTLGPWKLLYYDLYVRIWSSDKQSRVELGPTFCIDLRTGSQPGAYREHLAKSL